MRGSVRQRLAFFFSGLASSCVPWMLSVASVADRRLFRSNHSMGGCQALWMSDLDILWHGRHSGRAPARPIDLAQTNASGKPSLVNVHIAETARMSSDYSQWLRVGPCGIRSVSRPIVDSRETGKIPLNSCGFANLDYDWRRLIGRFGVNRLLNSRLEYGASDFSRG